MSPEEIERELGQQEKSDEFLVWPENWPVALAWMALSTQWRVDRPPMGGTVRYDGLRFEAMPVALDIAGIKGKQKRAALSALALMEQVALPVLNGIDTEEEDE